LEALTVGSPTETGIRTRAFADKAVQAALESDWATAVDLNTKILEANAENLEARNRLGRGLLETGKLEEAKVAYAEVLKAEPNNPIALRNVARLGILLEHKTKPNPTKSKTQPRLFIEDMGKTGILRLINPAPAHVVAKYSPGAEAELRERDGLIAVHARDGELLGFLEPKVGRRLLDLINTGNQYVVAVVSNDQQNPRVAIREILQSPENAQRISFPGHHRPAETKERAYIKGNFFRFGGEEEEDGEDETEESEATPSSVDEESEPAVAEEPLAVDAEDDDDEDEADE
jgi:tetratricopeptide (TPR) repeat protein